MKTFLGYLYTLSCKQFSACHRVFEFYTSGFPIQFLRVLRICLGGSFTNTGSRKKAAPKKATNFNKVLCKKKDTLPFTKIKLLESWSFSFLKHCEKHRARKPCRCFLCPAPRSGASCAPQALGCSSPDQRVSARQRTNSPEEADPMALKRDRLRSDTQTTMR